MFNFKFISRNKEWLLVVVSTLVLTLGMHSNAYKVADEVHFNEFQKEGESYILGRLIMSQRYGMFTWAGFTGSFFPKPNSVDDYHAQMDIITTGKEVDPYSFDTYISQTGGQAMLYLVLMRILPFKNETCILILWVFTALMSALALSLVLLWLARNFGYTVSIVTLILLAFSLWITLFGRNLWWCLWSYYIPFISLLYFYHRKKGDNLKLMTVFLIAFISVLVKCFFTGFEYITTTLIMAGIPVIYYFFSTGKSFPYLLKQLAMYSLGAVSAIAASLSILLIQHQVLMSWLPGNISYIIMTLRRRTSGVVPEKHVDIYEKLADLSHFDVFRMYWNSTAFELRFLHDTKWENVASVSFGELTILILLVSALALWSKLRYVATERVKALVFTTLLSFLAPLSWLVIFKAHSQQHLHINNIVWYMPYAIFAFALVGVLVVELRDIILTWNLKMNNKTSVELSSSSQEKR